MQFFGHIVVVKQLVWLVDERQGPSQLHGHCPWLVCDVALSAPLPSKALCWHQAYLHCTCE